MEQRLNTQDVAAMDAQTLQSREECVLNTGQHGQRSDAAVMDAQIKLRKEECATGMGQRPNDAAVKDA